MSGTWPTKCSANYGTDIHLFELRESGALQVFRQATMLHQWGRCIEDVGKLLVRPSQRNAV